MHPYGGGTTRRTAWGCLVEDELVARQDGGDGEHNEQHRTVERRESVFDVSVEATGKRQKARGEGSKWFLHERCFLFAEGEGGGTCGALRRVDAAVVVGSSLRMGLARESDHVPNSVRTAPAAPMIASPTRIPLRNGEMAMAMSRQTANMRPSAEPWRNLSTTATSEVCEARPPLAGRQ